MFAALTAIFLLFGTVMGQIPLPEIPGNNSIEIPVDVPAETPVPEWMKTQDAIQIKLTDIAGTQEVISQIQTESVWEITLEAINAQQSGLVMTQTAIHETKKETSAPTNTPSPVLTSTPTAATLSTAVSPSSPGTPVIYYIRIDNKGYIDLGWSKVEGAACYEVYAKKGDLSQNFVDFGKTVDTRMTKKSPFESGYILFKVRACKYSGQCGNFSSVKQINYPSPIPTAETKTLYVGDVITFGKYEQDNILNNGPEPIEWRVLAVENGRALLISKYGLDTKPYHEKNDSITWEKCSLREWLNEDFYNKAFDSSEKSRILQVIIKNPNNRTHRTQGGKDTRDNIFLLSIDEANQYFASGDDRMCQSSDFAIENGAWVDKDNGNSEWYLRSPGNSSSKAACVSLFDGHINEYGIDSYSKRAVRPAFWLDL